MSRHTATISWRGKDEEFVRGRYSREHTWTFDGGIVVPASPSPSVVRPPFSNSAAVDPEEAFVAAISSCHMLVFLHLASQQGLDITAYDDEAVGEMTTNERGAMWVSTVVLSPRIQYRGERVPTDEQVRKLHEDAHHDCFIANSIKTTVRIV
jgi:organic hydroperoxide reductase OsmC/OhrA